MGDGADRLPIGFLEDCDIAVDGNQGVVCTNNIAFTAICSNLRSETVTIRTPDVGGDRRAGFPARR